MKLGYFTMPLHPPGSDITKTLDDDLEQIITLDNLGYSEAWIGEHFTAEWENIPSPDLFIAKAIGFTKNIILGTGVTCLPNHNPFMVAHRIAQLDHMAHGRFHWGIGSGGFPGDFEVFGFDPKTGEHRDMSKDSLDLILQLWDNPKPGLYKHKYWEFTVPEPDESISLRFHMKPFQQPHPPIGVAGVSHKSDTLIMAGERGYIPMSISIVPTPVLTSHWESVEEGARKADRKANRSEWRIARIVYVAETTKQARSEALNGVLARDFRDYFIPLILMSRMGELVKTDPNMADSELTPEYLLDNVWVVGSPEDVANQLRHIYEEVGGFGVLLVNGHEWQPKEDFVKSMTLLKQEVMPMLSDLV